MLEVSLTSYKNPFEKGTQAFVDSERQTALQFLSLPSMATRAIHAMFMRVYNTFHCQNVVMDKDNSKKVMEWAKAHGHIVAGNVKEPFVFDTSWQPIVMYDSGVLYTACEETSKRVANEVGMKIPNDDELITIERMTWNHKEGEIERTPFELEEELILTNPELYPFIEGGPEKLIADFIKSRAKVMIFIGEPGTGKSSLIKYMAKHFDTISYGDDPLLFSQSVIARTAEELLMTQKKDLIVFEEIDSVIASRKNEANHLIPAILSATSGVITMGGKLLIVSNIESTKHIDAALMRSSRCFKVVRFDKLTQEQANVAADVLKVPHPVGKSAYSLAEITDGLNPGKSQGIGFI